MRPMKIRADGHMVEVFKNVYDYLLERSLSPNLHLLDNECSCAIQYFIKREKADIQLVEPHNHCVNAAKPVVKAVKYHIIAALPIVDSIYLLRLWVGFIPQIQHTLNMLRTLRRNNKVSAYDKIEGVFDWNRTPLGCKAVVYQEPDERTLWAPLARDAFYIQCASLHYRFKN